jgi:hypothetical protein
VVEAYARRGSASGTLYFSTASVCFVPGWPRFRWFGRSPQQWRLAEVTSITRKDPTDKVLYTQLEGFHKVFLLRVSGEELTVNVPENQVTKVLDQITELTGVTETRGA